VAIGATVRIKPGERVPLDGKGSSQKTENKAR